MFVNGFCDHQIPQLAEFIEGMVVVVWFNLTKGILNETSQGFDQFNFLSLFQWNCKERRHLGKLMFGHMVPHLKIAISMTSQLSQVLPIFIHLADLRREGA